MSHIEDTFNRLFRFIDEHPEKVRHAWEDVLSRPQLAGRTNGELLWDHHEESIQYPFKSCYEDGQLPLGFIFENWLPDHESYWSSFGSHRVNHARVSPFSFLMKPDGIIMKRPSYQFELGFTLIEEPVHLLDCNPWFDSGSPPEVVKTEPEKSVAGEPRHTHFLWVVSHRKASNPAIECRA